MGDVHQQQRVLERQAVNRAQPVGELFFQAGMGPEQPQDGGERSIRCLHTEIIWDRIATIKVRPVAEICHRRGVPRQL